MAKKTTTLFAKWREERKEKNKETEEKYLNPLGIRLDGPGDVVSLDALDWRDITFNVREFRVLTRLIGDEEFPLVDYFLHHISPEGEDLDYVLRYIPRPSNGIQEEYDVMLLTLQEDFGYDTAVIDTLCANKGYSFFTPKGYEQDREQQDYPYRVDRVELPYYCDVHIIKDLDGDGDVHDEEVLKTNLTFWDFYREEADNVEYLFVEMERTGWTTLYTGEEIDPAIVIKV